MTSGAGPPAAGDFGEDGECRWAIGSGKPFTDTVKRRTGLLHVDRSFRREPEEAASMPETPDRQKPHCKATLGSSLRSLGSCFHADPELSEESPLRSAALRPTHPAGPGPVLEDTECLLVKWAKGLPGKAILGYQGMLHLVIWCWGWTALYAKHLPYHSVSCFCF